MGQQQKVWGETREFVPTGTGNVYMDCGDFGISFNPAPFEDFALLSGDTRDGETAIVDRDAYYILNGDFRDEYAALAPQGLDACLRFFASKPELVSSWSRSTNEALAALSTNEGGR
jgi:hypothetical protein